MDVTKPYKFIGFVRIFVEVVIRTLQKQHIKQTEADNTDDDNTNDYDFGDGGGDDDSKDNNDHIDTDNEDNTIRTRRTTRTTMSKAGLMTAKQTQQKTNQAGQLTPTSCQNDDPNDYFNLKTFRMALARRWAAPGRPRRPSGCRHRR